MRALVEDHPRRFHEIRIAFRIVKPRHRADGEIARRHAKLPLHARTLGRAARAAELVERRAEVHHLHLVGADEPRVDHKIGRALRNRNGDVGVGFQQTVGNFLEPRRIGQVRVLVQNRRQTAHRGRQAAKGRGAVAVQMQHVDFLAIDDFQQGRQRRRIELRFVQIADVDAKRVERFLRQIFLAQADERDVEAGGVEARDYPREQPLHAVHTRALPAEMIADLEYP